MKSNTTATISRLERVAVGATIREWVEVATEKVFLTPTSTAEGDRYRELRANSGIFAQVFDCYTRIDADIKETDRLEILGDIYEVKGIKKYFGTNAVDICYILLEKKLD